MADQFVTLLDLTTLTATDSAVGIVEIVRDFSPEVRVLSGRPIEGINTYISRRKILPGGNMTMGTGTIKGTASGMGTAGKSPSQSTLFRAVGTGTYVEASEYEKILVEAYYVDGQLQVDEQIVKADPKRLGDILALESKGQIEAKFLALGRQFYYGVARDSVGFHGLVSIHDSANMVVTGSGSGAATESAWLVRNALDGIHWVYGNGVGLQAGQWMRQQVKDANSLAYFAYVNNFSGFLGLGNNHPFSSCRIANLDDSGTALHYLTDKMVAQALSKFPVGYPPTHLFLSRRQRYWLQTSRSVTSPGNLAAATPMQYSPIPTESNGIPIHVTDSIQLIETSV